MRRRSFLGLLLGAAPAAASAHPEPSLAAPGAHQTAELSRLVGELSAVTRQSGNRPGPGRPIATRDAYRKAVAEMAVAYEDAFSAPYLSPSCMPERTCLAAETAISCTSLAEVRFAIEPSLFATSCRVSSGAAPSIRPSTSCMIRTSAPSFAASRPNSGVSSFINFSMGLGCTPMVNGSGCSDNGTAGVAAIPSVIPPHWVSALSPEAGPTAAAGGLSPAGGGDLIPGAG
jgi:hypothetical protein